MELLSKEKKERLKDRSGYCSSVKEISFVHLLIT